MTFSLSRCLRHSARWHPEDVVRLRNVQYPLRKTLPVRRFNAALLPRDVACKARKMCLEARHGEIHKCANLRNSKPTLRGNQMHGHRGVLVLRAKSLQRGSRNLLSNVIREESGDTASFDG